MLTCCRFRLRESFHLVLQFPLFSFFNSRVIYFTGVFFTVFLELEKCGFYRKRPFLYLFAPQTRSEAEGCVPNRKCHFGYSKQECDWDRSLHQCFWCRGEWGGIPILWDQSGWQGENCDLPSPAFYSLPHWYSQLQPWSWHTWLQRFQLCLCKNHAFRYALTSIKLCFVLWGEISLREDKLSKNS